MINNIHQFCQSQIDELLLCLRHALGISSSIPRFYCLYPVLESPTYGSRWRIGFSLTINRLCVLPSTAQYIRSHLLSSPGNLHLFLCCQEHNATSANSFALFQIPYVLTSFIQLHLLTPVNIYAQA